MTHRLRDRVLATGLALLTGAALAGCGRSAPEGALPDAAGGTEPAAAGIRVVSDQTVVPPSQTTLPPVTEPTTTTTAVATTAVSAGTYVVEPGDTLSVIAEQFGVSVEAISAANGITDVNSIRPGQELIIPGSG